MEFSAEAERVHGTRRHTGVVATIIEGERPAPKTGSEIVDSVTQARFVEPALLTVEREGARFEYVPTEHTSGVVAETLMDGRLLYKLTVSGTPPPWLAPLELGTYYYYVDFVEGPDFDEGRWIGRFVDEQGTVVRRRPGVEIKQVFSFHVSDSERHEHQEVVMHSHGLGVGDVAKAFDEPMPWIMTSAEWQPHGAGCMRTFFCDPPLA